MLATRILSALALVPFVALLVWQGGLFFALMVAGAGLRNLWELYRLMEAGGYRPLVAVGMVAFLVMLADVLWQPLPEFDRFSIDFLVWGGLLGVLAHSESEGKLRGWALTVAGSLYIGWPMAHAITLRALPGVVTPVGLPPLPVGVGWVVLTLLATWACDSGAYFAGRFFGRHPFSPRYSPKKTWEGTIGGWVVCLIVTMGLGQWLLGLPLALGALLGLCFGPAAVYGDLAESMIKRRVGVKDSGNLIPGHGGLLDRMDSLLFTTVVAYYFAIWFTP